MISATGQRSPYPGTAGYPHAPNAALLIDFDNVTMGIRSDLGKELKSLLNSEVIRGKVAVQRAYADWRRYPQYIVPLAESSIDLIFAPAYGSSKKNATDLRMAIDAIELVFTRPEIGTFILMTGDSDFSSCVLKLKEYGKYVIGVGMRESSSDLLIQNCDEYYSYHSLSGLTRAGEVQESKEDPWVLMKRAAQQMEANGDVMRTDRLKQVMLDLDPAFDEKKIGYSKFSRFVQEAATKGVVKLRKGENGQYELVPTGEEPAEAEATDGAAETRGRGRERGRERESRRDGRRDRGGRTEAPEEKTRSEAAEAPAAEERRNAAPEPEAAVEPTAAPVAEVVANDIDQAYALLQAALRELAGGAGKSIRDGDVKRKMLDISPSFDESNLGFSKFTRFLRQAHDAEVIDLQRSNGGNYEVSLPASGKRLPPPTTTGAPRQQSRAAEAPAAPAQTETPSERRAPAAKEAEPAAAQGDTAAPASGRAQPKVGALRGRRGGRAAPEGPPPILPGQAISRAAPPAAESSKAGEAVAAVAETPAAGEGVAEEPKKKSRRGRRGRGKARGPEAEAEASQVEAAAEPAEAKKPAPRAAEGPVEKSTARARRGRAIRGAAEEVPAILPGQAAAAPAPAEVPQAPAEKPAPKRGRGRASKAAAAAEAPAPADVLKGLPSDREGAVSHLTSYKGVGQKTAEALVDAFGKDLFKTLQSEPQRVRELLGERRAGTLLDQWAEDYRKRAEAAGPSAAPAEKKSKPAPKARSGRGSRGGGRGSGGSRGGGTRGKKGAGQAD